MDKQLRRLLASPPADRPPRTERRSALRCRTAACASAGPSTSAGSLRTRKPSDAGRDQLRRARRPYDLRHACLSTWLNGGVYPTQVAEWVGHSVDVLLRIYARCVVRQDELAKRRISEALGQS